VFNGISLSSSYGCSQLEEKVQQWQSSPASALNPWFSMAPCWSELVVPALQFLTGESKGMPESDLFLFFMKHPCSY